MGNVVVWTEWHDPEVISVPDDENTVQGKASQKFFVAVKEIIVELGNENFKINSKI